MQKNGLQLREGIGVKKLAVEIISGRRLNRRDDLSPTVTDPSQLDSAIEAAVTH